VFGSSNNENFRKSRGRDPGPAPTRSRSLSADFFTIPLRNAASITGMRTCKTCQHLKRPEIDRRLAAGEPSTLVAHDYGLTGSSVHRHRKNCLNLASSNRIKKEGARGSAAVALLPSKESLGTAFADLLARIDEIVAQAQQQNSLNVAISGLNSFRQTLDSLARLAGHLQPAGTQVNVAVQTNVNLGVVQIAERLIRAFDHEPELKARIAQVLLEADHEQQHIS
jgi:hypothetical protein